MRIALAGAGRFGEKHSDALMKMNDVELVSIISRTEEQSAEVARIYGAKRSSTELNDALDRDDVDAFILCTPTHLHAARTVDLFACQAGPVVKANAIEGPHHPELEQQFS